MFRDYYPSPHTGPPLRAKDVKNWMGVRGDESRLVRCKFCGWICDPKRVTQMRDGSPVGKGVDYGTQQSGTLTYRNGKTETIYYYEIEHTGGCPNCKSYLYAGGK